MKTLLTWLFVFCMAGSSLSLAQSDVDDLKGAHKLLLAAVGQGNLSLLQAVIHPNAIGFFPEAQMPVALTAEYGVKEVVPSILADLAQVTSTTYKNEFRVYGTTGIVCTHAVRQPKEGAKVKTRFIRSTYVFSKSNNKWLLVSWHTSDIPLKQK